MVPETPAEVCASRSLATGMPDAAGPLTPSSPVRIYTGGHVVNPFCQGKSYADPGSLLRADSYMHVLTRVPMAQAESPLGQVRRALFCQTPPPTPAGESGTALTRALALRPVDHVSAPSAAPPHVAAPPDPRGPPPRSALAVVPPGPPPRAPVPAMARSARPVTAHWLAGRRPPAAPPRGAASTTGGRTARHGATARTTVSPRQSDTIRPTPRRPVARAAFFAASVEPNGCTHCPAVCLAGRRT